MSRQLEIWTVLRMIEFGSDYFATKRVDAPRLTIELMLAAVLDCNRFRLYLDFEQPLNDAELAQLRAMIKRRVAGEPLQYILGEAHFYRRPFIVRPGVLIPRPETEILVDELLARAGLPLRLLDIGTGSGAIAVTIAAERPRTEVVALDISSEAIVIATENRERHELTNVVMQQGDIFDDALVEELGSFDTIVSNPPYIADDEIARLQVEIRDHEPHEALGAGADGLRFYRRIAAIAARLLRPQGEIYCELGAGQANTVRQIFEAERYRVEIYNDLEKIPRVLRAMR